ncbi:MAG: AgmX/PglI C-terminal domain-containing protein [Deltaproteobacteria bacterium]|nr:AgmX/PglI C-terminal domain-containing protein [Deltaproteobacteria bacterium]
MSRINWRGALRASKNTEHGSAQQCVEVSVYWNGTCVQQDQFKVAPDHPFMYRIGETPECRFMVDREFIHSSEYAFAEIANGEVTVNIPAFCSGTVQQGDVHDTFFKSDTVRPYTLPLHGQLVCELGPWTFAFRRMIQEDAAAFGMGFRFAPNRWTYLSVAAHAVFFLLIGMVPPQAAGMNFDDQMTQNRYVKYMIPATEQHSVEDVQIEPDGPAGGNPGKAQAGDEGKAGDPKAKPGKGRIAIAGPKDTIRPNIGKEQLKNMAAQAGILSYLSQPTIVSPFGEGVTIGQDLENELGNLIGDAPGSAFGYGGFGINGSGRGGGDNGDGTLGVGNSLNRFGFSISGSCVGSDCRGRSGSGTGGGLAELNGKVKKQVIVRTGGDVISGSLSRDIIRRYIRQKIAQIRFCYEKELAANETLSGRVSVMFIISRNGAVTTSAVKESTIGNASVESCIAGVVKRITFPSPPDGGTVIVTYPFNLVSSAR